MACSSLLSLRLATPLNAPSVEGPDHIEAPFSRVHIAYTDEMVCVKTLANMVRLVRAVQQADDTTSGLVAKKALQYRHKLTRALAADVEDPAFDVSDFMGVTWSKLVK